MIISLDQIPSDIIRIIRDELNFKFQTNLRLVSKNFTQYPITDLAFGVLYTKFTDNILKSYLSATKLILFDNNVTDINCLINLHTLYILNGYNISDSGIKSLTNLTYLYIVDCEKITDINHFINLQTLHITNRSIDHKCGMDDNGIRFLTNLTSLDATNNIKISKISHFKNIHTLRAGGNCMINNNEINH